MWSTPAATAARSASSRSRGGPRTPSPGELHRAVLGPAHVPRAEREGPVEFPSVPGDGASCRSGGSGPVPGPLRLSSRVDLRAEAEGEAGPLEGVGSGAGRVDVGGGEGGRGTLDDRR